MSEYRNIERLRAIVEKAITRIDSTLDYHRTIEAIERLSDLVADTQTDEEVWYLGELSYPLDSILVGAYWHLTEWHAGQWSDGYRALCAVGRVFSPGLTDGPEHDSSERDIYSSLGEMARDAAGSNNKP